MGVVCSSSFIIDIEIPDEQAIPVILPNSNSLTVANLKDEIWRTIGVEKSHQLFSFESKLLNESKNLIEHGIQCGDAVQLIVIPTLKIPAIVEEESIYVQLQSGKVIVVTVPYIHTAKTISLKEYIQCMHGIPQSHQILIYAGKPLHDYRTLKGYGISYGDVLYLLLLLPVEFSSLEQSNNNTDDTHTVNVTLPSGKTSVVEVADVGTFKIDDVKHVVANTANIPASEQLYVFKGSVLEGSHSMKHYFIRYGDTVELVRNWYECRSSSISDINKCNACKAHVKVILHTGKFLNLAHADGDSFTVELIKQVIHEKENIPVGQQKLFFFGKLLRDYQSLLDCGICNNEELSLVVLPPGHMLLPESGVKSELPTTVDVILPSGNKLRVNIPDRDTYKVELLRGPVMSIIDAPEERQKYSFNGKLLHNYPSLSDYDIHYGDVLHLTLLHPTKRVYVAGGSVHLTILVPDLDIYTILDVKDAVHKQTGTSPGHLWLTFSGKVLRNAITLLEYDIGYGDTLDMEVIPREDTFEVSDLVRLASFHEVVYVEGRNVTVGPLSRKVRDKLGYRVLGATLRGKELGDTCDVSALTNHTWFLVVVDAVASSSRNVIEATLAGIKLAIYPLHNAS